MAAAASAASARGVGNANANIYYVTVKDIYVRNYQHAMWDYGVQYSHENRVRTWNNTSRPTSAFVLH